MKRFLFFIIISLTCCRVFAQTKISGKVMSTDQKSPLSKALVHWQGVKSNYTTTDSSGKFALHVASLPGKLEISHVGYKTAYELVKTDQLGEILILMEANHNEIGEIVVSSGYEQIPRERVTGSFFHIDRSLFNRRVSSDILSRLEDNVPGLVFNRRNGASNLSIRGRNTISGDGQPLIVVDNFPFEGDLSAINPNDIENVSILKDAAASSIWGARAGNGVIVITTKKGSYLQKPTFSFHTNFTVSDSPDIFYQPQMSSGEFIEWEQELFNRGYYLPFENSPAKVAFSPVVEILFRERNGQLNRVEAEEAVSSFTSFDIRNDYAKYLYRKAQNQQYSFSLSGGTAVQNYAISLGYDQQLGNSAGNENQRLTLNSSHIYAFLNKKLVLSTGIYYSGQFLSRNALGALSYTGTNDIQPIYPYARMADDDHKPMAVVKNHRLDFAQESTSLRLLDWMYFPLNELQNADKSTVNVDTRIRSGIQYTFLGSLKADLSYLYQGSTSDLKDYYSLQTYLTRDLINRFTQVNSQGLYSYPIPLGGVLDRSRRRMSSHSGRAQLNYHKTISRGQLNVIAGSEIRDHHAENINYRWYGYDDAYATSALVDFTSSYRSFFNPFSINQRIPSNQRQTYVIDRYVSYYGNAAYNWKQRYLVTGSVRMDKSNLFGVNANQKGVPLWSAGLAWVMSEENFIKNGKVDFLKLRLTYGSSGNVNKSISAYTTASYSPLDNLSGIPFATIQNPPNPHLKWEQVNIFNVGVDFGFLNNRIEGTVEWYNKWSENLFGQIPYAPSTGISQFSGNTSATKGRGVDLNVNVKIVSGIFKWSTALLFSVVTDKVTESKLKYPAAFFLAGGELIGYPLEGKPQFSIYSYRFGGLDGQNGNPLGYINGELSSDWGKIISGSTPESLHYHGSARPTVFGAIRNNLSWKGLSFSANISYRLGYYYRRSSINYASLLTGRVGHGDYEKRWTKPGDELITQVPSNPYAINSLHNTFYGNSSALVDRGDHIRLQDVRLSYTVPVTRQLIREFDIYLYANHLGILWKKSKSGLDPDYPASIFPPVRTASIGLSLKL